MTNYAGDPTSWPTSIPRLADHTVPDASEIDVPLEALADRTANAKARLDRLETENDLEQALNFRACDAAGAMNFAFFCPSKNSWILCGDSATALETTDWGNSFGSSIVAAAGSGENCLAGATDPSGNIVIATATRYVFERTASSGTVTKADAIGAAATYTEAQVAYDSVRSKWLLWADGPILKTSSNRITWANGTTPSLVSSSSGLAKRMTANPTTGRVLFATYDSSPETIYVHRTDDAASTWSTTNISQGTLWPPERIWLCFNEQSSEWLLSASRVSDHQYTRVWRSADDGVTWTLVTSLSNAWFGSVAAISTLWVATSFDASNANPEIVWSKDAGVTWARSGIRTSYGASGLFCGGGGFVLSMVAGDQSYFSHRMGAPALGTLT